MAHNSQPHIPRAPFVDPINMLKHPAEVFGGNANPGSLDIDSCPPAPAGTGANPDMSVLRRLLNQVAAEIVSQMCVVPMKPLLRNSSKLVIDCQPRLYMGIRTILQRDHRIGHQVDILGRHVI